MFVFLLGGVDFLFLFLLSSVEAAHNVGVNSFEEQLLCVVGGEM